MKTFIKMFVASILVVGMSVSYSFTAEQAPPTVSFKIAEQAPPTGSAALQQVAEQAPPTGSAFYFAETYLPTNSAVTVADQLPLTNNGIKVPEETMPPSV